MKGLAYVDSRDTGISFVEIFLRYGHQLEVAESWSEFIRWAESEKFDFLMTQTILFQFDAIVEALREVRAIKVILRNLARKGGLEKTEFNGVLDHPFLVLDFEAFQNDLMQFVMTFSADKGGP